MIPGINPNPDYKPPALPEKVQDPDKPHRTCLVAGSRLAIFHGFFQKAYTSPAILVGDVGGQFAFPVALVEYLGGQVDVVLAECIRFTDGMEVEKGSSSRSAAKTAAKQSVKSTPAKTKE